MALTSITLTTGANIPGGRALARNGAVTLDTNVISVPTGCGPGSSTVSGGSPTSSPSSGSPVASSGVPTPGTSLDQPPGSTPLVGGPTVGSRGGPAGGPPGVSPSPGIPVTAAPPDVSTPNTGRGLLIGHFIVGAGLVLFGVVMLMTGGRRSHKSR